MHIVKGHFRDESGLLEPGTLLAEKHADGWRHPETLARMTAREYVVCRDHAGVATLGVEIDSPDAIWCFVPDPGECERIGMEVSREA